MTAQDMTAVSDIARHYFQCGQEVELRGDIAPAIHWYDQAIAASPGFFEAHVMRAQNLRLLGRRAESLTGFDRAIECKSGDARIRASLYLNRGVLLAALHRFREACEAYTQGIAVDPQYAALYGNRALSRLTIENLSEGFQDLEMADRLLHKKPPPPWWWNGEPVAGKTVVLHDTAGIGDALNFCRYARLLLNRGAKVILKARPAIAELMSTLQNVDVITYADRTPPCHYQLPISGAVMFLERSVDSIYAPIGYLRASDSLKTKWRKRLGDRRRPRVGIAWWTASNKIKQYTDDEGNVVSEGPPTGAARSIPLSDLIAHLPANFEYVSLQHEVRDADEEALRLSSIAHFGAEMTFDDAAAVMECCDLVIANDSSLAHLAGALGRPVWIALHYSSDWRWFSDRSDCPWYPTARLYRQQSEGNWSDPLRAISADLTRSSDLHEDATKLIVSRHGQNEATSASHLSRPRQGRASR